MAIIRTNDGSQYQKPTAMATIGAIAAGSTAQGVITAANNLIAYPLLDKIRVLNNPKDSVEVSNALKKALENSGLAGKVELVECTGGKFKNLKEFWGDLFKRIKTGEANLGIEYVTLQQNMIKEGFNAGFAPIVNKIMINTEKMGLAGFHEIGHAINFNNSKFWKVLSIMNVKKVSFALSGIFATIALFKRPKAEGEEPTGAFDKVTTFIKNNVGKLTFAAMIPLVAEELKATARGNKLAKEILRPELYEKVVKSNKFGAATYIGLALLSSVGVYLGNKLRDAIAKPKQVA